MDGMASRADWSSLFTTGGKQAAWRPVEVVVGLSGRRGLGISYGLPRARVAWVVCAMAGAGGLVGVSGLVRWCVRGLWRYAVVCH